MVISNCSVQSCTTLLIKHTKQKLISTQRRMQIRGFHSSKIKVKKKNIYNFLDPPRIMQNHLILGKIRNLISPLKLSQEKFDIQTFLKLLKQYLNLILWTNFDLYQPYMYQMLPLSHKHITHISSESRPYFSHQNLRKSCFSQMIQILPIFYQIKEKLAICTHFYTHILLI